jgi:capsular polysaccharide transport system permease protein
MATLSDDLTPKRGVLREAVRIQGRVLKALILREMHTRYGRENIGLLWLVIEPMILATMIGLIHSRGARVHQGDLMPVPFSILGYCGFMMFRSIMNRAEGALESNLPLMYHRTVTPLDILIARALLDAVGILLAMGTLMSAAVGFGLTHLPVRPGWLLAALLMMFIFSFGGSLIVAGLTFERKAIGRLVHPFTYVMMPLSGAFFSMDMLPAPFRPVLLYIPLAHIFEMLRYGWFYSASARWFDVPYVLTWLLGMMLLGLILLSQARKRIHMP